MAARKEKKSLRGRKTRQQEKKRKACGEGKENHAALEEKAEALASKGEWATFINILALLVFGMVLFPNVDGLVDLAMIYAFLAARKARSSLFWQMHMIHST